MKERHGQDLADAMNRSRVRTRQAMISENVATRRPQDHDDRNAEDRHEPQLEMDADQGGHDVHDDRLHERAQPAGERLP